LPPGLPGLPQTITFINSSSQQWIVFTGFAMVMLLTAWLAVKILKDIDKVFSTSSGQKSAAI